MVICLSRSLFSALKAQQQARLGLAFWMGTPFPI